MKTVNLPDEVYQNLVDLSKRLSLFCEIESLTDDSEFKPLYKGLSKSLRDDLIVTIDFVCFYFERFNLYDGLTLGKLAEIIELNKEK